MKGIYKIFNNVTGEEFTTYSPKMYNEIMQNIEAQFEESVQSDVDEITTIYKSHKISTRKYFENDIYNVRTFIDKF